MGSKEDNLHALISPELRPLEYDPCHHWAAAWRICPSRRPVMRLARWRASLSAR